MSRGMVMFIVVKAARMLSWALNRTRFRVPFTYIEFAGRFLYLSASSIAAAASSSLLHVPALLLHFSTILTTIFCTSSLSARMMLCRGPRGSSKHLRVTCSFLAPGHRPIYQTRRMAASTAKSLDHIVLTVKDIPTTIKWYGDMLNMTHTSFTSKGAERHALKFGDQKINLHLSGKEFEPKAQTVQPGSADLCFLVQDNVDDVLSRLKEKAVDVLEGGEVVDRTGARGKLRSVYLRDPDGNLVE